MKPRADLLSLYAGCCVAFVCMWGAGMVVLVVIGTVKALGV